jgi:hypothetical protein
MFSIQNAGEFCCDAIMTSNLEIYEMQEKKKLQNLSS